MKDFLKLNENKITHTHTHTHQKPGQKPKTGVGEKNQ